MIKLITVESYDRNLENVFSNTLKIYKKQTSKQVINWIYAHPDFPSLNLLGIALNQEGFKTLIAKIGKHRLNEIPLPAIAHINDGTDRFVIITQVEDQVHYHDSVLGYIAEELNIFTQRWNGLILLLEEPEVSKKSFNTLFIKSNNKYISTFFPFVILFIMGLVCFFLTPLFESFFFLTLGLIGLWVTTLIKQLEVNQVSSSICKIGTKVDCNAVLSSNGSTIYKEIKASDLAIFWFSFLYIFSIICSLNKTFYDSGFIILKIIGLFPIAYVFYSIGYQWLILKKWCLYCLLIQLLLLIHFGYSIQYIWRFSNIEIDYYLISTLFIALSCSFLISLFYSVFLRRFIQMSEIALSRNKFSLDERILNLELELEEQININNDLFPANITTTSQKYTKELCMVLNPLCVACKTAFKELVKLQELNPTLFKMKFVLVKKWNSEKENQIFNIVFSQEINKRYTVLKQILLDEYDFSQKFQREDVNDLIEIHASWFRHSKLTYTPRYYINNSLVSEKYQINDIIYHLYHLKENEQI
jgi:uncharacterized membrane protein